MNIFEFDIFEVAARRLLLRVPLFHSSCWLCDSIGFDGLGLAVGRVLAG
ncbi:MAG: hypothetical protein HC786_00980 [Richelia sp. CSU_2_1]|nr:hypothetical protein [Richelia sp. CSU_2_1]